MVSYDNYEFIDIIKKSKKILEIECEKKDNWVECSDKHFVIKE